MHVSRGIIQIPQEVVEELNQLRLDLRQAFDEFLARVDAVVDRHIERHS